MKLEWKEEYNIGIEIIDKQHKELLHLINNLSDAEESNDIANLCIDTLNNMSEFALTHFGLEEGYFEEFKFSGMAEHKVEHHNFIMQVHRFKTELLDASLQDIIDLSENILKYLQDWLIDHVMGTDRKYLPLFKEHGLK